MMKITQNELNIYEFQPLYDQLLEEIKKDELVIDMREVNKVDMSIIQLFISTKKSCDEESKKFLFANVNQEVTAIFKNCACDFLLGDSND